LRKQEPMAYLNQELKSHLANASKAALAFGGPYYAAIVSRRIAAASQGEVSIPPEQVRSIIRLSALLHDVGKADDYYQTQPALKTNCPQDLSFHMHEVPSAVIADRISRSLNLQEELRFMLCHTVLTHHYAMRSLRVLDERLSKRRRPWTFLRYSEELSAFLHNLSIDAPAESFADVTVEAARKFLKRMERVVGNRKLPWTKLYILFLNPLVFGDNCDAQHRQRPDTGEKPLTGFWKELIEVIGCPRRK
jgi:CRISPR-associated endonuclease Cas3-HD